MSVLPYNNPQGRVPVSGIQDSGATGQKSSYSEGKDLSQPSDDGLRVKAAPEHV